MINKISNWEDSLNQNVVDTSSTESDLLLDKEGLKHIQWAKEKQKIEDLNQANNLTIQLLKPSLDSFKNPLDVIFKQLDYYERNKLQDSDIKKNPLDRAKQFISSFEERVISEIYSLKWSHNHREMEQAVSKILFNVWLLARDEKYKNIWQNAKNNIIDASVDVLWYDFENIERFIRVKHATFQDFWFLMDHKLSWNGIGDWMIITPNGEWHDPKSDTMWKPLEASLYILKKTPYLSYWIAKNLVGNHYESYLQDIDVFDEYVNKYNK